MLKQNSDSRAGIYIRIKKLCLKINKDLELNHSLCLFNFMGCRMRGGGGNGAPQENVH